MGYKTYVPVDGQSKEENDLRIIFETKVLENEFLKVTIDELKGGIKSIIDKKSNIEMVKQGSEYAFGSYMYERFSKEMTEQYSHSYVKACGEEWAYEELGRPKLTDDKYKRVQPQPYRVEFEQNVSKVSAILHFQRDLNNPYDYTIIYTLQKNMPYLEIQWGIVGKSPESWPEAGWLTFPFNMENPKFKLGRLGSIVDPQHDFIKGTNFDYCFSFFRNGVG